jgi:DNA-binding NarL/FixJ family response regulator
MNIRVLLADDHHLVREGLRALLEKQPDIEVIAEVADGRAALEASRKFEPDVVVMDIAMPIMSGIDATRQISAELPATKIVVLSMHGHRQIVMEVIRAGAAGYLLKDCAHEDLAQAIRTVNQDLTFFSPELADMVLEEYAAGRDPDSDASASPLNKREEKVCKLLAEGKRASEIASELGVSTRTIEADRRKIMNKLGIDSDAALTKYAIRTGLTDTSS